MIRKLERTSRRLFLGFGLSAVSLLSKVVYKKTQFSYNAKTSPGGTTLSFYNANTKVASPLGFVVGIPQGCRSSRPGGTSGYGTREWIKEITFVEGNSYTAVGATITTAKAILGPSRLNNDQYCSGCGHISMNVPVWKISLNGGQVAETQYSSASGANLFYALVAAGTPGPDIDSPYIVTDLWISDKKWANDLQQYIDAESLVLPATICQ